MDNILLTGGFGYIGSHTASVLAEKGLNFVIFDNFSNCKKSIIYRLEKLINKKINYVNGDIRDTNKLINTIKENQISSVIHFAALKSVEDSIFDPIKYYETNVSGTISLLNAMKKTDINKLVFSSSATIYGEPEYLPIDEKHPIQAINPYGDSKLIVENILRNLAQFDEKWSITCLRYFNPIGAHNSGLIGDDPLDDRSQNIVPSIIKVINGSKFHLEIFGDDYDTKDGTGVRDYIHILDIADAHVEALNFLENSKGIEIFNLGTGNGFTVMELVKAFEGIIKTKIPKKIIKRRKGDVSSCYADPTRANNILKWRSKYELNDMCLSAWNFSKNNY